MDYDKKIINIEIELDMNELRKTFHDDSLLSGDIVRMLCRDINEENSKGAAIIKVVRATQLLEKKIDRT